MAEGLELISQHLLHALGRTESGVVAILSAVAAAGAAVAMPPLLQRVLMRPWTEDRLGDLLPLDAQLDDSETLRCVDGTVVLTLEIWGVDTHGLAGADRVEIRERKNELFYALAPLGVRVRMFTDRRRQALTSEVNPAAHPQRRLFVETWNRQFEDSFLTRHVLVLSVAGGTPKARDSLRKARTLALELLKPFGVRALSNRPAADARSDLLSFWAGIANRAAAERFPCVDAGIGQVIATGPVTFDYAGDGRIESVAGDRTLHGYIVSLGTLPSETVDDICNGFLVLPHELTLVQHVSILDAAEAEIVLDWRQRQASNTYVSTTAAAQFAAARSEIAPGSDSRLRLCHHSAFAIAWGRTVEEALEAREAVRQEFRRRRMVPVDEVDDVAALWWSQWPSFDADAFMRGHLLTSRPVADLATLERPPIGLMRCDWGTGAPLRCRTAQGTPYHLSLHESAAKDGLAHTIMFGRSGSGKTTLLTMLAMGATVQFPRLQARYFDRLLGQYVAVTAHGGRYVRFDGPSLEGVPDLGRDASTLAATLQPFRRPLTPERRQHILDLLRLMSGAAGATPEAAGVFDHMLRLLGQLDVRDRSLQRLVEICVPRTSTLRQVFRSWLPGGAYGHIFGHDGDDLTGLEDADLVAFDMTSVLEDPQLAPVVVADISFEIRTAARLAGRPGLIGLDESKALFAHPGFKTAALHWLTELRKARQAVVLMFQYPGQVDPETEMALRTQTATHIFFRDARTHYRDFERWGFTRREMAFIKRQDPHTDHMEHACLVKKPDLGESVVVDFSLRRVGDLALLFKSGNAFVQAAQEARRCAPGDWLPAYITIARAIAEQHGEPAKAGIHSLETGAAA